MAEKKIKKQSAQGSEQQLRATIQQIQDTEQQLRAANNQLQAQDKQLRSANRQLLRNEEILRQEKELAQQYLDLVGVMVVAINIKGKVTLINRKGCEILGYAKEKIIGSDWFGSFLPPKLARQVKGVFKKLVAGKIEPVEYYENPVITKKGEIRTIAWHNTVLKDTDGRISGTLSSGEDITEQRTAEERLKHHEDHLRQSEKMRAIGQLAGGVAHDFNNQLAAIQTYGELIRERVEHDANATIFANNILECAQRSSDLTQQLLAFARKTGFVPVSVDIHNIIKSVIKLLEHSLHKKITIKRRLRAKNNVTRGDMTQLENAILNLALNARDAMPSGGQLIFTTRDVELDARYCNDSLFALKKGTYIQIAVTDTGSGMAEEVKNKIFEPFFTTKEKGKGTGMGMAAVFGSVTGHKGAIEVLSAPDQGTTVEILLPIVKAKRKMDLEKSEAPAAQEDVQILVVDDEELVASSIQTVLVSSGYRVMVCKSGREALELYKRFWNTIDLIILDMVMPDMDGEETFQTIQEINPAAKVLLQSGYSANEGAQQVIEKGAAGFIQKPFKKKDLLRKISEALGSE